METETSPARKKKRKKKKSPTEASAPAPDKTSSAASPPAVEPARSGWGKWFWVGLVVVFAIELVVYGYRGAIEVCVGRAGVTDFGLKGQPRTEGNRAAYPECHQTRNIGLKSGYEDAVQESAIYACRRATLFQGQDALLACSAGIEPFQHKVDAGFVPPWEPDFYRRLFWFLFSE